MSTARIARVIGITVIMIIAPAGVVLGDGAAPGSGPAPGDDGNPSPAPLPCWAVQTMDLPVSVIHVTCEIGPAACAFGTGFQGAFTNPWGPTGACRVGAGPVDEDVHVSATFPALV